MTAFEFRVTAEGGGGKDEREGASVTVEEAEYRSVTIDSFGSK